MPNGYAIDVKVTPPEKARHPIEHAGSIFNQSN
jgi:hypothetical protein